MVAIGGGLFAFARLYDVWQDPKTGKEIYSYTIITTAANEVVEDPYQEAGYSPAVTGTIIAFIKTISG
jgi:hypothetical protein